MSISNINAYDLITTEELKDINSTGYLLRHKKTGAKNTRLYLKRMLQSLPLMLTF